MGSENPVLHTLTPTIADLGEFTVRRALPNTKQRMVGPWIFFDHMGPVTFQPGPGVAVRPHPHINLATVTYLFEGEIFHRDSLGSAQAIRPGDINLMVAGQGIVHSERELEENTSQERTLHGLQLWLALPETDEETTPEFLHYPAESLPSIERDGVPIRVMIGSAYGQTSPVKTFSNTLYVEAHIGAGKHLPIPSGVEELAVYVAQGNVEIGAETLPPFSFSTLDVNTAESIKATEDSRLAFIGGDSIGSRFIWWNFVSSRKERIEQAKQDWKEGRFAKVPGDAVEFIPLPES